MASFIDEDNNNERSYLVCTTFEPTGARDAFPCFDEPHLKAPFKLKVGYDPKPNDDGPTYVALSNNAVESEIDCPRIPGWKLKTFKETVPMSTYLASIIVAKYKSVEGKPPQLGQSSKSVFTKPSHVYGPSHMVRDGGQYSADQTITIMTYFQEYTGVEYHLDKIDSAIIPDFQAGALENWGLNWYRASTLMNYGTKITSEFQRLRSTNTLSHELIHQWYGNSVTCEFWDQIWLNEGFATYFEYHGVNVVDQEFKALEYRQFDATQYALEFDASPRSIPLVNDARVKGSTFEDYMTIFNTIPYQKGAALLRMLEAVLTTKTFQKALRNYATEMEFKGAHQDDLFAIIERAGHEDLTFPADRSLRDFMNTWSLQSGFPLVRVSKISKNRIYLSQERFTSDVKYTPDHGLNTNLLWAIPVAIATAAQPDFTNLQPKVWIENNNILQSYAVDTQKWMVVNADGAGYYRVMYDDALFELLKAELNNPATPISISSRSQIIDDYFAFYAQDTSVIEKALDVTTFLQNERSLTVWSTVFNHLEHIMERLQGNETVYAEFKEYFLSKINPALNHPEIGLPQPPTQKGAVVILRSRLLDWACALGDAACQAHATATFKEWPATGIAIDVRGVVFCGAVAGGDVAAFGKARTFYEAEGTAPECKPLLLNALTCTTAEANTNELLAQLLDEAGYITKKDLPSLFSGIAANTIQGRKKAIDFLVNETNSAKLIEKLEPKGIEEFFETLSLFVIGKPEKDALNKFIADNKDALVSVEALIRNHMDTIEKNGAWLEKYADRLLEWFTTANGGGSRA